VSQKLEKRRNELVELKSICEDFAEKLKDMRSHLDSDLLKIEDRRIQQVQLQAQSVTGSLLDEHGNPVDLLSDLDQVQAELEAIMGQVRDMETQNELILKERDEAEVEFNLFQINYNTDSIFQLLKVNGVTKKRIISLIRQLKDVSKRLKETKNQYQQVRARVDQERQQRKLYKAVVGDLVDELFADYINRLGCPVPVKRTGQNNYMFGTKKISAKIINGRLVIRVGGGYMGIEEFMMYYGQQELLKIQKEEAAIAITSDLSLLENDEDIVKAVKKSA